MIAEFCLKGFALVMLTLPSDICRHHLSVALGITERSILFAPPIKSWEPLGMLLDLHVAGQLDIAHQI